MTLADVDGLVIGRSSIAVRHVALAGRLLVEHLRANGYEAPSEALEIFAWCELTAERQRAAFDATESTKIAHGPGESESTLDYMTSDEAAGLLGVTPQRIGQLITEGELAGERVGRRLRVDRASVQSLRTTREARSRA